MFPRLTPCIGTKQNGLEITFELTWFTFLMRVNFTEVKNFEEASKPLVRGLVCTCACVCTPQCACGLACMYSHMPLCVYVGACAGASFTVWVCVCACACLCACARECVRVWVCACECARMKTPETPLYGRWPELSQPEFHYHTPPP